MVPSSPRDTGSRIFSRSGSMTTLGLMVPRAELPEIPQRLMGYRSVLGLGHPYAHEPEARFHSKSGTARSSHSHHGTRSRRANESVSRGTQMKEPAMEYRERPNGGKRLPAEGTLRHCCDTERTKTIEKDGK